MLRSSEKEGFQQLSLLANDSRVARAKDYSKICISELYKVFTYVILTM